MALSWPVVAQPAGQGPVPLLGVTPAEADLGEVPGDKSLTLEFTLHNQTSGEIRLKYIFAQCDCTLLVPDSAVVPARGQYILRAQLLTEGRDTGPIDELITILTDKQQQPELLIPITAMVIGSLDNEERSAWPVQ